MKMKKVKNAKKVKNTKKIRRNTYSNPANNKGMNADPDEASMGFQDIFIESQIYRTTK